MFLFQFGFVNSSAPTLGFHWEIRPGVTPLIIGNENITPKPFWKAQDIALTKGVGPALHGFPISDSTPLFVSSIISA